MIKTVLFSDNSLWGCLNFRGYIIDRFIKDGYKVVIAAPNDSFIRAEIPEKAVYEPVKMERTGNNPLRDFSYMMSLRKIYKKHNPSVVFHYTVKPNIYGTLAARMLGIPSVAMVTGLGYVFANESITAKIARNMYKSALQFANRVLFLNEDNYKQMLERGMVKREKSHVMEGGEGVNVSDFPFVPEPESEHPVFLMVARVLYDKGYVEFVEAAKANPQAKFRLIGAVDTNPHAVPESVVKEEKAIDYLGFMPHEEVLEYMGLASCVVLPSYHEGMSVTLMEAIAMGRPVICSDIAGCREMVDEGINGYTVPVKDGKKLAEACRKFIALTYERKREMSQASRRKAERQFDIRNVWETYRKIIQELNV